MGFQQNEANLLAKHFGDGQVYPLPPRKLYRPRRKFYIK